MKPIDWKKAPGIISILLIFSLLPGTMACSEKAKQSEAIEQQVAEWLGRQIQFPSDMVFMRYAMDTVPFNTQASDYKILVYTDSTGCAECKLQLRKWIEMIAITDSIVPGKVNYLFFFDDAAVRDIRHLLKKTGLQLPVSIDSDDGLNHLNHFPEDINFQTFLLDKENSVVAVGNPTHSPAIRELYIKQIQGDHSVAKPAIQTTATLEPTEVNFGKFTMKEKRTAELVVTNNGDQPLELLEAISSCGCTDVTFSKEPVSPGKSITVQICFTPQETGMFSKAVTLYANIKQPFVFTLRGEIVSSD